MIRKKLQDDFRDCQWAEFSDNAYMRTNYVPADRMPSWVAFCIFVGVVFGITALSLQYFDVLIEKVV